MTVTTNTLPAGFESLERFVDDWALPAREARYAMRLSKTIGELGEFYDAVAPLAERAISHLNQFDLDALPEAEHRLLLLLYSMILVSYAVNIFKQPRIPDSGAAFLWTSAEPMV